MAAQLKIPRVPACLFYDASHNKNIRLASCSQNVAFLVFFIEKIFIKVEIMRVQLQCMSITTTFQLQCISMSIKSKNAAKKFLFNFKCLVSLTLFLLHMFEILKYKVFFCLVAGVPLATSVLATGVVCTFYTTLVRQCFHAVCC